MESVLLVLQQNSVLFRSSLKVVVGASYTCGLPLDILLVVTSVNYKSVVKTGGMVSNIANDLKKGKQNTPTHSLPH